MGLVASLMLVIACDRDDLLKPTLYNPPVPKPYRIDFPEEFGPPQAFDMNITEEGISLGKKLFFDPILSADGTQSCASCHNQEYGFTDNGLALSIGIDGLPGTRNSMPLFNLAWSPTFFWDGRSPSLPNQALAPVVDPLEMHNTWPNAIEKLQNHPEYPELFQFVYGTDEIDSNLVTDAIAQYEMTLISNNSTFDKQLRLAGGDLNRLQFDDPEIYEGFLIFVTEPRQQPTDLPGGDCFHCHQINQGFLLTTLNQFENNGLDADPDSGLAKVTKQLSDIGKFKTPAVRNLSYTAPYMHDGRYQTLEQVVNFYSDSVNANSPNIAAIMKKSRGIANGLNLTEDEKRKLIKFLRSLDDEDFITDPRHKPE